MDNYNSYYPAQPGHPPPQQQQQQAPPPPPPMTNQQQQQHGGPQMQQQPQQQPPNGGQMMHAPMPLHNIRQAMPPGPPSHHHQQMTQQPQPQPQQQQQQQQQQPQHIGHHSQQMPPQQQQQHPNYHQMQQPQHPHAPQPVSHSGSPHPQQQQQHQHLNHQPNLPSGQLPGQQQAVLAAQQHHLHPQSPHHHPGPPPMHMQQQQQPLNHQMVRPPLGPSLMNHPQPGLQQVPHHHQNFFNAGPMPPQSNLHHYPQQNQHHQQQQHHHHHQQHHHHHQPQMMHHPPPMAPTHHPNHIQQAGIGRNSPYYSPNILQTEFRIIELNRRLQSRPIPTKPMSPLPNVGFDEGLWWERFATEFFEDDATLTLRIQEDKPVEYTIGRTLIPRFFRNYFDGGVTDLSINLRNPKEAYINPQLITLECDQAFIITNNIFESSGIPRSMVIVHTEGHLILEFVSNNYDTLSIKSWKFYTKGCREYIDRSITAMGLPNSYLVEPAIANKQGISKSTISYLKMCMIMEPMQELMLQHRMTKLDPKSCLQKYLFDRYKFRSSEDNRVATNRKERRKRKPSAQTIASAASNKKPKANVNNSMCNNNSGLNNILMSPSGAPSFSLASQDVMVVGEPSMMGGDFGDDNERVITRMENTQYDPTASTPSNAEESDSMNTFTGNNDNGLSTTTTTDNNIELNIENHTLSPSLLQQRQQQHPLQQQMQQQQQQVPAPVQVLSQLTQIDQSSPQHLQHPPQQHRLSLNIQDQNQPDEPQSSEQSNQRSLIEGQPEIKKHEDVNQISQQIVDEQIQAENDQMDETELLNEDVKPQIEQITEEQQSKINSIGDTTNDSILGVNSVEQMENHSNSIQNDESNSNSQLPCSTASATSTIEQQQPVDNGVA